MTRQITTEYLRLGHLFLGKTDDDYQVSPSSPGAVGSAAPAAASASASAAAAAGLSHPGEGASSETSGHFGGSSSSDGRPPRQQPPPKRGAHSNGAAKAERGEKGAGPGAGKPHRGRRVTRREEEDEEGVEMRATTKSGAARSQEDEDEDQDKEGANGPSFESASDGPGRVERGGDREPPRPLHGVGERGRGRGPYRGGVDGVEDRWIGFAGSPRGERPTLQGARQSGSGDIGRKELVGNGVELEYYAGGTGSDSRNQDGGKEAAVDVVVAAAAAAPQGETWAAEESEAFLEEDLEEMLSGTSR